MMLEYLAIRDQFNKQTLEDKIVYKLYSLSMGKPRLIGTYDNYRDAETKGNKQFDNYKITEHRTIVTERDRLVRSIT